MFSLDVLTKNFLANITTSAAILQTKFGLIIQRQQKRIKLGAAIVKINKVTLSIAVLW